MEEQVNRLFDERMFNRSTRSQNLLLTVVAVVSLSSLFTAVGIAIPEPLVDPFHPDQESGSKVTFTVEARSTAGTSINLDAGQYLIVAAGQQSYLSPSCFTAGSCPDQAGYGSYWADPECTMTVAAGNVWTRNQYPHYSLGGDMLDLYVNNQNVEWTPINSPLSNVGGTRVQTPECDTKTHKYFIKYNHPGGPLRFNVFDWDNRDNGAPTPSVQNGLFVVDAIKMVPRPAEELISLMEVPANAWLGINSPELIVGEKYRFEVAGTYQNSFSATDIADAECSKTAATSWTSKASGSGVIDDGKDPLDLNLDDLNPKTEPNGNVQWTPAKPTTGVVTPEGTCADVSDVSRTYSYSYVARDPGGLAGRQFTRLNMKINDATFMDDSGALTVKIFHVKSLPAGSAPQVNPNDAAGTKRSVDTSGASISSPISSYNPSTGIPADPEGLTCAKDASGNCIRLAVQSYSASNNANVASVNLPEGLYTFVASGQYEYSGASGGVSTASKTYLADAECSGVWPGNVAWSRNQYPHYAMPGDMLDLYLNGQAYEWSPRAEVNSAACNDDNGSSYQLETDWPGGTVYFSIKDWAYTDNAGAISVQVFQRSSEQLIAVVPVNSADPVGSLTPVLLEGRRYRFEVSGQYTYYGYGGPGYIADAECTSRGSYDDFPAGGHVQDAGWTPHRFDSLYGGDPQDLYLNYPEKSGLTNGTPVKWEPAFPGVGVLNDAGQLEYCADPAKDPNHTYVLKGFSPQRTGTINLRVFEPQTYWYSDNYGSLTVKVFLEL